MSFLDGLKDFGKGALTVASGGATDPQYSVDPNTGQTVTTQQPRSTGDMFKSMFAGMLSGLAGGVNAHANGGPGGGLAAFANGAQANNQRLRQVDQQKRQQAQTQFDDQQTATMRKAQVAQMTLDNSIKSFGMAKDNVALQQNQADAANRMNESMQSHPGSQSLGVFKDFNAFVSAHSPEEQKDIIANNHDYRTVPTIATDSGVPKVVGVQVYKIPQGWGDKPTDHDVEIGQESHIDPKTGINTPTPIVAKAGSITNNENFAFQSKLLSQSVSAKDVFAQHGKEVLQDKKDEAAEQRENTRTAAMIAAITARGNIGKLSDDDEASTIEMIHNLQFDPEKLSRMLPKNPGLLAHLHTSDPDWSEGAYKNAVATLGSLSHGNDHKTIVAVDTAIQHAQGLKQIVQQLPNTGDVRILNGALMKLGKQFGMPEITNAETLATALGEELGKGYAGGAADVGLKKSIHDGLEIAGPSRKQLIGTIDTHAHAQWQRLGSVAGEARSAIPNLGKLPQSPNISKGGEAAFHSFGLDNPFNFGAGPKPENGGNTSLSAAPRYIAEQFYKIANGDKDKARQLAASRGWTQ